MADLKISELTPETNLVDADLFEISTDEGGGVRDSRKMLASDVKTYMQEGQTGTSINSLAFRIPVMTDDSALQFALEVFTTADYSGTSIESFNTAISQTNVKVSDGIEWIAFPAEGVGTPYYSNRLSISLQNVVSNTQYYIRFKFFVAGSVVEETPWEDSQYPVLDVSLYEPDKKTTKKVVTATDNATAIINVDITDVYELSAISNNTTFSTSSLGYDGQTILIRLKDAGVAKSLTWSSDFVAIGVTAPIITVANKWHYVGCQSNNIAGKWHILACSVEA